MNQWARSTFGAVGAVAKRDLAVALTYRLSFALTLFNAFWSLMIFRFVAELVDPGVVPTGGDYFDFVVVGLALFRVVDACLSGAQIRVRQEQVEGTLEVMAVQPVTTAGLGLGWSAYAAGEALSFAVLNVALALPLGLELDQPNWVAAVLILLLTGLVFIGLGLVGAALVVALQQGLGFASLASAGLALISGVYFPLDVLPGWLEAIGRASPLTYSVDALRGALLDGDTFSELAGDLAVLVLAAAVAVPLGLGALRLAFRTARRRGTFGIY